MVTQIKMCKLICTRCTTLSTVWNFTNWECYPKKVSFPLHQVMLPFIDWLCNIWGLAIPKRATIVNQYSYIPYIKFMKSIRRVVILLPLSAGVSFLAFPAAVALATDINWYCFESYSYGELGVPGSEL